MKNVNVKKLALAGILVAVGIVCSPLSIPVGASKCAPVQHFINILGGVFLGPGYAVGMAFVTSLLRNLMGTGTLLAFPGSMCGAFLCGMLYKYGKHLPLAYLGELFGTSVIGGLLSYPIAHYGKRERSVRLCTSVFCIELRRNDHSGCTCYRDEEDESIRHLSR